MPTITALYRTAASCLVALLLSPLNAEAQLRTSSGRDARGHVELERLKMPVAVPFENLRVAKAPAIDRMTASDIAQPTSAPTCRRGRRALIGALIGAGGTVPFIGFVHTRFENEAANGTAAATTAVALGAAAGAFIGLATCGG